MPQGTQDFMDQFKKAVTKLADDSKAVDKSWQHIGEAVDKVVKSGQQGYAASFMKLLGKQSEISNVGETIKKAFFDPKWAAQQSGWVKTMGEELQKAGYVFWPAILGSIAGTARWADKVSDSLRQGNMALSQRYALMQNIARVQIQTGASTEVLSEATSALVDYGFDLRNNFQGTLDVVTKMKVGLGVSASDSARLAATAGRLKTDFNAVADGIARVKTDTALAADEATRFASEIGNALALLGPKSGANLGVIAEYVNRLEGAAKGLGIQAGSIKDLLTGFTKEEGMMGIASLGFDPSFLSDVGKTKAVTEGFVSYVEKQLAGTTGFQRMATMRLLAEQFNTTVDVIGNARNIMDDYNKQLHTNTTLDKEWADATKTFSGTWEKLKNSFGAVMKEGILPLIKPLNWIVGLLADVTTGLSKMGGALSVITALIGPAMLIGLGGRFLPGGGKFLSGSLLKGMEGLTRSGAPSSGATTFTNVINAVKGTTQTAVGEGIKANTFRAQTINILKPLASRLSVGMGVIGRVLPVLGAAMAGWNLGEWIGKISGLSESTQKGYEIILNHFKPQAQYASELRTSGAGDFTTKRFYDAILKMKHEGSSTEDINAAIKKNMYRIDIVRMVSDDPKEQMRRLKAIQSGLSEQFLVEERRKQYAGITVEERENKAMWERSIELAEQQAKDTAILVESMRKTLQENERENSRTRSDNDSRDTKKDLHRMKSDAMTRPFMPPMALGY